jgi:hypothetical protein
MTRILRRPMFRMGGNTDQGIMSGVVPRQGYSNGNIAEQLQTQKSIIDALAPRAPRKDRSLSNFLIDFGLDVASATPSGSIFSTAAKSAREPFGRFQQAKQLEEAYKYKEASEDRDLIASLIKGMDEDKLSALMKDVKAGVESGLFKDEKEGINQLLKKKIYGVQDMPGEAEADRIRELELMISRDQEVPAGMIKSVAEHIYKIETDAYPEDIRGDLNKTKTYIKPNHIAGVKRDDNGDVVEIVLDSAYDKTYSPNQIYFDAQTGELFKRTSKQGEGVIFTKVILD